MGNSEGKMISTADPFAVGREEAAERYGHLAKNAAQWRLVSLILLLCCVVCVFVALYTANKVTVVPYLVKVTEHGYLLDVKTVNKLSDVEDRFIRSAINQYIWSLRTVFNDRNAQAHLIRHVSNSTPTATLADTKLRTDLRDHMRAMMTAGTQINTVVNSVLQLPGSENRWQAEWTETAFSTSSRLGDKHYRGIFTVAIDPPRTMDKILVNPLGIYITDFNFNEILGGKN